MNGYLCALLDCSRNGVMKLTALKKFIDTLASMGYNALQLYTEDTYEIKEEPLFGYMRGRYSQQELKEIDAYAKERGVELIPCIQVLGHLDQLFPWKRFQPIQDMYNVLLVGEEETYALIDNMFATCAECFGSRKINICMDEVHVLGLGKYLDKHGYEKRSDILLKHLTRVCEIAKKYGFSPIMWSDMFFKLAFGAYHTDDEALPQDVLDKVPQNVSVAYWNYMCTDPSVFDAMLKKHKDFKRPVWFAGTAKKFSSFCSGNAVSIDSLSVSLPACKRAGVENVLITLWGDYGDECSVAAVLPSLFYAAKLYHGEDDIEIIKRKFEEQFGEKWDDFMLCDMLMPEDFPKKSKEHNGAKTMLYCDPFLGRYDSMVFGNGKERKAYAALAKKFKAAKERSSSYGYLFEFYESLCKVLSVKYDLGYLTRKYYQGGEREKLASLIGDYKKLIGLLEKFIELFRKTWNEENKPHGFDIHDIRLGGLLQRVKYCHAKLKSYLSGEIDVIEELEEKLVEDESDNKLNHVMENFGRWSHIATVNRYE